MQGLEREWKLYSNKRTSYQIASLLGNLSQRPSTCNSSPGVNPFPHGHNNPALPKQAKNGSEHSPRTTGVRWRCRSREETRASRARALRLGTQTVLLGSDFQKHRGSARSPRAHSSSTAHRHGSLALPFWKVEPCLCHAGKTRIASAGVDVRFNVSLLFFIFFVPTSSAWMHLPATFPLSKLQHKVHPWLITEEWNFQLSHPRGRIYPWWKPELSSETNLALGDFFPPTNSLHRPFYSWWIEPLVFCL